MDKEVSNVCYMCYESASSRQRRGKIYCRVSSLESSFVCAECSTPFSMGYEVTQKQRSFYACKQCDTVFHSKLDLRCHSCEHSNVWPYRCKECEKGFRSKRHLERHMDKYSSGSHYKCDSPLKFKRNQHMNTHEEKLSLECNLKRHMLTLSDEKPHKCDICGLRYKWKGGLSRHMNLHDERCPFRCEQCNKICDSKYRLKIHMIKHSKKRPFKCNICRKTFKRKIRLNFHKKKHA